MHTHYFQLIHFKLRIRHNFCIWYSSITTPFHFYSAKIIICICLVRDKINAAWKSHYAKKSYTFIIPTYKNETLFFTYLLTGNTTRPQAPQWYSQFLYYYSHRIYLRYNELFVSWANKELPKNKTKVIIQMYPMSAFCSSQINL